MLLLGLIVLVTPVLLLSFAVLTAHSRARQHGAARVTRACRRGCVARSLGRDSAADASEAREGRRVVESGIPQICHRAPWHVEAWKYAKGLSGRILVSF